MRFTTNPEMVPLKKVFPIIVVLITLSLLGLIYIQFSWIHNASIVRREQIEERAINVLDRVREEMLARTGPAIRLKMNNTVVRPTERGLTIDKFNSLDLNIGVSDRYTTAEVKNLLISGLRRDGLVGADLHGRHVELRTVRAPHRGGSGVVGGRTRGR